ncbi:hypothetical protein HZB89_01855 [archaeon]|nr:hypothetical protein [archaeon]
MESLWTALLVFVLAAGLAYASALANISRKRYSGSIYGHALDLLFYSLLLMIAYFAGKQYFTVLFGGEAAVYYKAVEIFIGVLWVHLALAMHNHFKRVSE